jgi:L,D-transpeptidase ErfK/SrfK
MIKILFIILSLYAGSLTAATFEYQENDEVVGQIVLHTIKEGDNFLNLAQTYRIGFDELVDANPDVDPWIPEQDQQIVIPSQFVLPNVKRDGVVINLAELRIYHFYKSPQGKSLVSTYPISIGKGGEWNTPLTETFITRKQEKPSWYPPESIRKEHEENNDPLPRVVPPGPDNPLGDYSLRLALPGYLIHGTRVPEGIGMRVTHGCIRLHPIGIEKLFSQVKVKTPVLIVNQPYKIGWRGDKLYVETHSEVKEQSASASSNLTEFVQLVINQTKNDEQNYYEIFWERGYQEAREKRGVPFVISLRSERTVVDESIE